MKSSTVVRMAVSTLLLSAVIGMVGPEAILAALTMVSGARLALVLLLFGCTLLLGGINLWLLLRAMTTDIRLSSALKCSVIGWSGGVFTPGKVGELSAIYLLTREGVSPAHATAAFLADKGVTLLTLFVGACAGAVLLSGVTDIGLTALLISGVLAVSTVTGCCLWRLAPARFRQKIDAFNRALASLWRSHRPVLAANLLLTLLKWVITAAALLLIFGGIGYTPNLFKAMCAAMTISLLNLVPVTLHGLGLKELAAVPMYGSLGIPADAAVAASLLMTVIAYAGASLSLLIASVNSHRAQLNR